MHFSLFSERASGKSASHYTDKNQDSSNVGQAEQPKLKKKKTPAQVARDRDRRKSYWKRIKLARQLRIAKLSRVRSAHISPG